MRKGGLEPPRVLPHRILNPARLPVPPLSRVVGAESRGTGNSAAHRGGQAALVLNLASAWGSHLFGVEISHAVVSNLELIIFGGLIIFFLIVEPNGLARLWQIAKEKLRLWPFPH